MQYQSCDSTLGPSLGLMGAPKNNVSKDTDDSFIGLGETHRFAGSSMTGSKPSV